MKMVSLTSFWEMKIEELKAEGRFSTAYIYEYGLRALTEFVGGGEIFFGAVSRVWLRKFQAYLEEKQRKYNTISTYLRVLRAVYNRAVDERLIEGEYRLFSGLKMGVASEKKLAVNAGQMGRLMDMDAGMRRRLPAEVRRAQDLLSLMVLLQGMPFTDLAHLHKGDLEGDVLTCRRQKTGTELCVTVVPEAMALLNRYRSRSKKSPYLLRILNWRLKGEAAFEDYREKLGELNLQLSRLPELCGVKGLHISSYTARHTWATLAKFCGVPEEVISEALGHSSLEVTRTYLKSFEKKELSRANKMIIDYINSGRKTNWNSVNG